METALVSGYRRVPEPPARMIPFMVCPPKSRCVESRGCWVPGSPGETRHISCVTRARFGDALWLRDVISDERLTSHTIYAAFCPRWLVCLFPPPAFVGLILVICARFWVCCGCGKRLPTNALRHHAMHAAFCSRWLVCMSSALTFAGRVASGWSSWMIVIGCPRGRLLLVSLVVLCVRPYAGPYMVS